MHAHNLQRSLVFLLFLAASLFLADGAIAKQRLKCECTNCTYAQGRAQSTYVYPVDFNATLAGRQAYNAAESGAMKEADQAAIDAAAAALKGAPSCQQPCENPPAWLTTHGPPFAGGTGGNGIARSRWKVTYTCAKAVTLVRCRPRKRRRRRSRLAFSAMSPRRRWPAPPGLRAAPTRSRRVALPAPPGAPTRHRKPARVRVARVGPAEAPTAINASFRLPPTCALLFPEISKYCRSIKRWSPTSRGRGATAGPMRD